ncbi:MAG TPA: LacI family DNA-binding transcriptional regulator [Tepidisphaeraceae bacterium]|nr:LacI family DNA-binding transcriptional regulator [Tepidisphaeraceae bacterium]
MATGKRVTMAQVARRAGVSRSAVTAALSDRVSTVGLNPATRRQIRKVAEELGYQPNILSRSFIKQRSYLIGMIATENFFLFTLETIKGIEDVLEATDYSLLAYYHGSGAEEQSKQLQKAISRRVDGMIIMAAAEPADGPNHRQIAQMQKSGVPVVQIHRRAYPGVPTIMMDEEESSFLAVRHLIVLGHRRIAHVTYRGYREPEFPGEHAEAQLRANGYARAMRDAGLDPAICEFDRAGHFGIGSNDYTGHCEATAQQLADTARHFAAAKPRITGITTFNDYTAIGLIHNFNALGMQVPRDVSIVGYDNTEAAVLMRPPLTTLRPRLFEIGRRSALAILQMMDGRSVEDAMLPPDLVVRGSTSRPVA